MAGKEYGTVPADPGMLWVAPVPLAGVVLPVEGPLLEVGRPVGPPSLSHAPRILGGADG